jgi:hypothetical protein
MNNTSVTCPVSINRINESVARVAAFFTIVITIIGVYFKSPYIIAGLAIDFYLRAFTSGKYSPLKAIAKTVASYIGLPWKQTDAAPKKFAAAVGFVFTVAIAILFFLNYEILAYVVTGVLLVCAALESFAGYCVGCVVYTYTIRPFLNEETEEPIIINL